MASDGEDAAFDESFFDAPAQESDSGTAPSTPVSTKRKRGPVNTPGTVNDEDEVARRRRRRQSLAFLQRRKSLTLSGNSGGASKKSGDDATGGAPGSGSGGATRSGAGSTFSRTMSTTTSNNRQYISDMYSTIIKMSSENKINVKNSWSLHLIDHMEDILGSSRKEDEEDPDDTYNFQKASCTLDASIKIYSYRVDDTWNSSYKILENLSRTDENSSKQQADSDDEENPDEPKSARKARKTHTAAKTIEKNLNNINLKNYELEFEADPLFHKMSQSFDEGGAKGMLLANLGLYDGCKILLNSSDVGVSTRKPLALEKQEKEETKVKTEVSDPNKRINLSLFGTLACFTEDVQSFEVCPPLSRLYEQLDEYYGDEVPQLKVKTTSEHLIKTPVKPKRLSINETTPVRARLDFDDMDDPSQPMDVIEEVDEEAAEDMDVEMEDTEDNNDFDYGGGDDGNDDESATDANPDAEANQVEDSEHIDGSQVLASQVESEFGTQQTIEVLDTTANAADFFKSRAQGTAQVKEETTAYTMMIENALLRSATSANDDLNGTDDYSYFDVKMLRNWAGPVHWKFPAVRKVQSKQLKAESKGVDELALIEASDGEEDEAGVSKVPKTPRGKKTAADQKAAIIDFFAADEPDLKTLLKQPRAASSITMSKIATKRQDQKASELVFPVDSHVEIGVFFQHFMKPKLRFFKRQQGQAQDTNDFISSALDATYRENEDVKYESGPREERDHSVSNYGDDYDYDGTDDADDDLYSTEGLISANRVVEKIDVHYERFAKRVDVKKLKHNIWDHLEKETKLLGDDTATATTAEQETAAEVEHLSDDFETRTSIKDTTFESVVQSVSDRVPPDVTVSFYFICMLHLANEKGLELVGQDDLRNFKIRKEQDE